MDSRIRLKGVWNIEVVRVDGTIERKRVENTVTALGLNGAASRLLSDVTSPFAYSAIGSGTSSAVMSETALVHEIARTLASTRTNSGEVAISVSTYGGASDSITGVVINEAGLFNHVNSGQGVMFNRVSSLGITLANSDMLKLQVEVQVGSHDL